MKTLVLYSKDGMQRYEVDDSEFCIMSSAMKLSVEIANSECQEARCGWYEDCGAVNEVPRDIFIIAGQSNGRGENWEGPAIEQFSGIGENCQIYDSLLNIWTGPREGIAYTSMGSMILPLATQWYAITGNTACFIQTSIGSTSVLKENTGPNNGNWSPDGYCRGFAMNRILAGLQNFRDAGKRFRVIGLIWAQGEADVGCYYNPSLDYYSGLDQLFNYFRAGLTNLPIGIIRTGTKVGDDDRPFAYIRDIQDRFCDDGKAIMLYRDSINFPSKGMMLPDNIHYNQSGLNDIGKSVALSFARMFHNRPQWRSLCI